MLHHLCLASSRRLAAGYGTLRSSCAGTVGPLADESQGCPVHSIVMVVIICDSSFRPAIDRHIALINQIVSKAAQFALSDKSCGSQIAVHGMSKDACYLCVHDSNRLYSRESPQRIGLRAHQARGSVKITRQPASTQVSTWGLYRTLGGVTHVRALPIRSEIRQSRPPSLGNWR